MAHLAPVYMEIIQTVHAWQIVHKNVKLAPVQLLVHSACQHFHYQVVHANVQLAHIIIKTQFLVIPALIQSQTVKLAVQIYYALNA
jgi:hypothetical protein